MVLQTPQPSTSVPVTTVTTDMDVETTPSYAPSATITQPAAASTPTLSALGKEMKVIHSMSHKKRVQKSDGSDQ